MDEGALRVLLARGVSVEEIGRRFHRNPSTVAYWMRRYGLEASNRARYAPKGALGRVQLEALIERGLSIAEIAAETERGRHRCGIG